MTKCKFQMGSKRATAVSLLKRGWVTMLDLAVDCNTSRPDAIMTDVRKAYKVKTKVINGIKRHRI